MRQPGDAVAGSASAPMVRFLALGTAGLCAAVASRTAYGCGSALCAVVTGLASLAALALCEYGATGRLPGPISALQHFLVGLLLALAADGSLHVWQAPAAWPYLLHLSGPASGLVLILYLAATASLLLTRGRPPSPLAAVCFLLGPLLFNVLLVLQSPALLETLGRRLALGAVQAGPALRTIGIWGVVALFNEAIAVTLSRLKSGRWPRDVRLHLLLFAAAAWAALTPTIAAWGTSPSLSALPAPLRPAAALAATILSQAGLWAQTFLVTGLLLDAFRGRPPAWYWVERHFREGLGKGAVYSGLFIGLMMSIAGLLAWPEAMRWLLQHRWAGAAGLGALSFPLAKTIAESFDGSPPFFRRLRSSYADSPLYLRGSVVGLGIGWAISGDLAAAGSLARFLAGFALGAGAYFGVDLAMDSADVARGRRQRLQSWRPYALRALLGGLVGGGLAWYLDTPQLAVVVEKFRHYAAVHFPANGLPVEDYVVYPLFSKWGAMDLGQTAGGVRLLFNEALSGVVNWSLAAPLFSMNLVLLTALVQRSASPLRQLFTREGGVALAEQAVRVLRWGLWMAPIIYSLLRIAPEPSWYNQDGAVRTVVATWKSLTLGPGDFRAWSLNLFLAMLVNDWLRVLIWFDHMGLRVATLVNLSFVGGDRLDEAAARFVGHTARCRVIPEGIRRFATWAPLLIPFYLPRGADWEYAWGRMETLRSAHPAADLWPLLLPVASLALGATLVAGLSRRRRAAPAGSPITFTLGNGVYALELSADGQGYSRVYSTLREKEEIDLTRRPGDPLHPCGKFFYLVDQDAPAGDLERACSLGDEPMGAQGTDGQLSQPDGATLRQTRTWRGLRAEATVRLVGGEPGEIWRVRLTNLENRPRRVLLTSYREFVLSPPDAFERHQSYHRLHLGTWFLRSHGALIVGNRLHAGRQTPGTRATAFHAVRPPADGSMILAGYQDSRSAFAGSDGLRAPAGLEGPLLPAEDEGLLYSFDPAASLQLQANLAPYGSAEAIFVEGYAEDERQAARRIERWLDLPPTSEDDLRAALGKERELPIPPADTCQFDFNAAGTELRLGWSTPRPWCHLLANEAGYGLLVRNDGALYSFMGNSQQYGLTPFPGDESPLEVPGQALYLQDLDSGAVLSPTHLPARDRTSQEIDFGLGYAVFRKIIGEVELELTLFVPPHRTAEVRLLRVRNRGEKTLRYRLVPYAQMMLAEVPRDSRSRLDVHYDSQHQALFFAHPGNDFFGGWAFVAPGLAVEAVETLRSRFVGGPDHTLANPAFLARGSGDPALPDDGYRVAAFAGTLTVPPGSEVSTTVVLGWAERPEEAAEIIQQLRDPAAALVELEHTRSWWRQELSVLRVETDEPAFDQLVNNWLPYQLRVSRLWGRLGPSQRGGGFGYRDQLQDVLPLVFTRPEAARRQILLHAAQQFREGDVLQWWHQRRDGTTGLGARNRASDPHLWLVHVACRYLEATGDFALLGEQLPFLEGQQIPAGAEGLVFAQRVSRDVADLYEHLRRAIDITSRRVGPHGLPLIGTGDWNDGFSRVGAEGRGESVWLGFFLHRVLVDFAAVAERREGAVAGDRYLAQAEALKAALDAMWREDRYVRAITDAGEEMLNTSALASAWPALSGAVPSDRAARALASGLRGLEEDDLVRVLHPPFTEYSRPDPGRISNYPPGVRENGGQYSHGASWLVDAFNTLAESAPTPEKAAAWRGDAWRLWRKISPLAHVTAEAIGRYGLPPHQQPADIYAGDGYFGRGGWSWYTGAAARMLSAAYGLLGLKVEGGELTPQPGRFKARGGPRLRRLWYRGREVPEEPDTLSKRVSGT